MKINAVKGFPVSTTLRQLRSFLGLTSYYKHFVKSYARIVHPLHALTGKNVPFDWTDAPLSSLLIWTLMYCVHRPSGPEGIDQHTTPFRKACTLGDDSTGVRPGDTVQSRKDEL